MAFRRVRKPSYLSPKSLLTKQEYSNYTMTQKIRERDKLEAEIQKRKKEFGKYEKQRTYSQSRSGKVSNKVSRFLKGVQSLRRTGVTRSLYNQGNPQQLPQQSQGSPRGTYSKRGRPVGTVKYRHPVTGQPIGVYEYRKILSHQNRMNELKARARNPRQQEILRRIEQQEQARQMSPERRTIPSTSGNVPTRSIFQEIEDATRLVD